MDPGRSRFIPMALRDVDPSDRAMERPRALRALCR